MTSGSDTIPGDEQTQRLLGRAHEIQAHISSRDPLLVPSEIWTLINAAHEEMLLSHGLSNFKRGLAQNYSTFMVGKTKDPRFRAALRSFLRHPTTIPFLTRIGRLSRITSFNGHNFLAKRRAWRLYGFYVGLLWSDLSAGEDDLPTRLSEPDVGNPIPIRIGRKPISQDLASSIREFRAIKPYFPSKGVLAEIGAGYGRLGYVGHMAAGAKYWVFDIAPALTVSEWYLSEVFPERRIFRWRPFDCWEDVASEVGESDIAFFSADQLSLVPPNSVDVFAAISCLHEFTQQQRDLAVVRMADKTRRAIYTKNWTRWHNRYDDLLFQSSDLTAPEGWKTLLDRPDEIWSGFTEKLFARKARMPT